MSVSQLPAAQAPQAFHYDLTKTFGIQTPNPIALVGGDPNAGNPFVPKIDPIYVFLKDMIRNFAAWWAYPCRNEGFLLWGPTGSGKTTFVKNFFARLSTPVVTIPCGKNTKLEDYLFQPVFSQDGTFSMKYRPGPLSEGITNGYVILLDEVDRLPAKEATRLHEWMEGAPLVVPQLSPDPIPRSPKVRFVATANTQLRGDESGVHPGAQRQDGAFLQRFVSTKVGYMGTDVEKTLVKSKFPALNDVVIDVIVELANATRAAYVDNGANDGTEQLGVVLSTRKVLELAHYLQLLKDPKEPFKPALDLVLLNSATDPERDAIERMLKMITTQSSQQP